MKRHTRQGQIKTIRQIQSYLKTYLRWKECGTKASFFKRSELDEHIFHLQLITTLTDETKIAVKANQLQRLLTRVLKYEYDEEPPVAYPPRLKRVKDGQKPVSRSAKVRPEARTTVSPQNKRRDKKVQELL